MDKAALAQVNKLKKNGGVGYIEHKTVENLPETIVHVSDSDNSSYHVRLLVPLVAGDNKCTICINGSKNIAPHVDNNNATFYYGEDCYFYGTGDWLSVGWNDTNNAPESITISVTQEVEITHTISKKFLPKSDNYKGEILDLDWYGITESILSLFAQGGGTVVLESANGFWDNSGLTNTNVDLYLSMIYQNAVIIVSGITRFVNNEGCFGVAFSFLANDGNNVYSVSVNIATYNEGASITVKVA